MCGGIGCPQNIKCTKSFRWHVCRSYYIWIYLGGTIRAAEIVGLPPITIYNMSRNAIRPTDDVKDFIQRWLSPKQVKSGEYLFHDEFI